MILLGIIFLFIILPMLEIYLIFKFSAEIGFLTVLAISIGTAILGGLILKMQGLAALNSLRQDMSEQRAPIAPVADGVFLLVAVPFLMTPGFITDIMGFLLLVPPIRQMLARMALRKIKAGIDRGNINIQRF